MRFSLLAVAILVGPSAAAVVEFSPLTPVSAPSAMLAAGASIAPLALTASPSNLPSLSAALVPAALTAAPAAVLNAAPAPAAALAFAPAALSGGAVPFRAAARRAFAAPGGESKISAARLQLDAPSFDGSLALAYEPEENAAPAAPSKPSSIRTDERSATGNLSAFGGVDHEGHLTRAALRTLAELPDRASLGLKFSPTPDSFRALAGSDGVLLARTRAAGRWFLVKAGADGFAAAPADSDFVVIGRAGLGRPDTRDLRATEGRAARYAIASRKGLFEWSADMPAGTGAALEGSFWARALARAAGRFYPRLLSARGVAFDRRAWERTTQDWIDAGRAPVGSHQMASKVIPGWMRAELPVTAAKLGMALTAEKIAGVLARSAVWVYSWNSSWSYEVEGLPDGHYDSRFGIRVMLRKNWRRLKDAQTHFRVLYAHEYTHWLQNEGVVTRRYGVEIPAVAVEQLRAMELVGWDGMKAGKIGFIAQGNLDSFEKGRVWARGDMADATALMYRGVLGGAAYEVGVRTGRPAAAWEFLNLVIAEKDALSPRAAFEKVSGSTPGAAR